jgi:lysophospholipase L1-like esterase
MKKYIATLVITCSCFLFASAQQVEFKDGDRVCFVGNSITMGGEFHHQIALAYALRFPDRKITFYNCGISGDVTGGILNRMDSDILVNKPNWCVLMAGMNDVNGSLYTAAFREKEGVEKMRQNALMIYRENMEAIIKRLLQEGIKVALQKPTIYDETAKLNSDDCKGRNAALGQCAIYVQELANKYHLPVVDYYNILLQVNSTIQKRDSTATIIGKDRVHPGPYGNFVMAYQFLKTSGFDADCSVTNMSLSGKKVKTSTAGASISNVVNNFTGISFKSLEQSLPFPAPWPAFKVDSLVPFTTDLNREILKVKGLKKGKYELLIDSTVIATFSNKELSKGINLSLYPNAPQYKQALSVQQAFMAGWALEARLRVLKFVEYGIVKSQVSTTDKDSLQTFFNKVMDGFRTNPQPYSGFYQSSFNKYNSDKPIEQSLIDQLENARKKIWLLNKPQPHLFTIRRK